jgi:prepilin-type processing-associated H-X9-DG protein
MVVVSIIALLLAILMPMVVRTRDQARLVGCANNLHQLVAALGIYSVAWHGSYPLNRPSGIPVVNWYDDDRIGSIIPARRPPLPAGVPGGGVYVCPSDQPQAVLSYAVNAWASLGFGTPLGDGSLISQMPASGRQWGKGVHHPSQMILMSEAFSWKPYSASVPFLIPKSTIGSAYATSGAPSYAPLAMTTAGRRFGGAGGIQLILRVGAVQSELAFYRHRVVGLNSLPTDPRGEVNIAYADGHVESKTNAELVRPSGETTGDSYWSPADCPGD